MAKHKNRLCAWCKQERVEEPHYFKCNSCVHNERERERQKKEIRHPDPEDRVIQEKGTTKVYGRDVVQPTDPDGRVNQRFIDRYGDGIFKGHPSQLDGQGKEKR